MRREAHLHSEADADVQENTSVAAAGPPVGYIDPRGLTGSSVSTANLLNKIAPKVLGVLSKLGYATDPTVKAFSLWVEILRNKKLPPGFIRRALDITLGSLFGVIKPLFGDIAKATAQATVQTAVMVSASPEERRAYKQMARYLVANQFDAYFYPNLRPLRICGPVELEAMNRAFSAREEQIDDLRRELAERRKQIDGEEDDGWDDEPEEEAPPPPIERDEPAVRPPMPPPLPPRKLEKTIEKAVEEAVVESGLAPDTTGTPSEAPAAENAVWEKVAENIEQAKSAVPAQDWAAAAQGVFSSTQSSGGLMVLVEWALQLVTTALQGIFRNQDPSEIKQMVDAERPYAEQFAMLARDRIVKSAGKPGAPAAPAGSKNNMAAALGAATTGVSFLSNFLGAFKSSSEMSEMITAVLTSGAAMSLPRRRTRIPTSYHMEERRLLPPPRERASPMALKDESDEDTPMNDDSWTPIAAWTETPRRGPPVPLDDDLPRRGPPVRMSEFTPDDVPRGRRALMTGCDACGHRPYSTRAGADPARTLTVVNGKNFLLSSGAFAFNPSRTTGAWIGYGDDIYYDPAAQTIIHNGRGRWVKVEQDGADLRVKII